MPLTALRSHSNSSALQRAGGLQYYTSLAFLPPLMQGSLQYTLYNRTQSYRVCVSRTPLIPWCLLLVVRSVFVVVVVRLYLHAAAVCMQ